MPTACPSDDELLAAAQGHLAITESARVNGHLVECSICAAAMAEAARGLAASKSWTFEESEARASRSPAKPGGAPEPVETLKPGEQVGRYVITGRIGQGAMGAVYAAQDPELNRKVAIKVLRPEAQATVGRPEMQARLLREAQAMARLSHPSVVAVHDVGAFRDRVFVAMELVEGSTLRQWLKQSERSWGEVLDRYLSAGRGLAAAHAAGLVHRDFKPDNVSVGLDGRPS